MHRRMQQAGLLKMQLTGVRSSIGFKRMEFFMHFFHFFFFKEKLISLKGPYLWGSVGVIDCHALLLPNAAIAMMQGSQSH